MKIKTNELKDLALDWVVAKCEGPRVNAYGNEVNDFIQYSRDWAQGGPIIEREGIRIVQVASAVWGAVYSSGDIGREHFSTTPLIAAMRCYVASKLGDEVEIPKELAQ